LLRGHTALAFVDVGVGFADRAAVVVAVGFSQDIHYLTKFGPWKREIKQQVKLIRVPYVKHIETNS
jgi:hypothetical protein